MGLQMLLLKLRFMGYLEPPAMKKKALTISCIVLLALIGTLTGESLYMLNYSLRPENRGKDLQGSMEYMMQNYPQLKPWVDSLQQHHALKDTFITAPDGIRLHAYYAYASHPSRRTAVIVHGYGQCHPDLSDWLSLQSLSGL